MVALPLSQAQAPAAHGWGAAFAENIEGCVAPPAVAAASARARERLQAEPLPSRRAEAWRFTETATLAAIPPAAFNAEARALAHRAAAVLPQAHPSSVRLLLDGASDPLAAQTLPAGLQLIPAAELDAWLTDAAGDQAQDPWTAQVAVAAGPLLALKVRGKLTTALELVSEAGAAEGVLPLQLLLVLEPGASLELLEVHRAAGASLTAIKAVIRLAEGASLRHGLIAQGAEAAVLLADFEVRQEPGSAYAFSSVVSGWGLSRLEPRVLQVGGGASTRLRSLQRCDGRQVADQHSAVRFEGPEGVLDQLHKTIAAGAGRSVFNGAVAVPRQAQRTDAAQLSRSLLLSDRARVDSKPQLEIVADDVKCAHGATVTRLQEEELFYLRSRGISAATAAELLLRGYCEEVLQELPAAAALWQPQRFLLGEEAPAP